MSHEDGIEHGFLVVLEVVLREYAESFARTELYGSLCGLQLSADGFEQGGLASAVGTDYAVDVSVGELEVDVLVEDTFAELNGDV